jgi:hypothetical protein
MFPMDKTPAAPMPQKALAMMKLPILCASAHHAVEAARKTRPNRYSGRRPMVSDMRPKSGWIEVEVNRNAVESQDAEFEAKKYEVITGWLDAMSVESNIAICVLSALIHSHSD